LILLGGIVTHGGSNLTGCPDFGVHYTDQFSLTNPYH
jgi:hypothetical protein